MSDGLYALVGVIVGATTTGIVQVALDTRARRRAARVSARLVLDAVEDYFRIVRRFREEENWPTSPKLFEIIEGLSSTWEEHKEVLAETSSFKDWVDVSTGVHTARNFLLPVDLKTGREVSEGDLENVTHVLQSLESARRAVERPAMTSSQRRQASGAR